MNKKNVSKRIQELLSTATPKQKAMLVCKDWIDRPLGGEEALLTEDEAEAIKASLKEAKEIKEYNKWVVIYNVYKDITPLFGLVYKEYLASAERLLGYLRRWEAYDNEENHLIALYEAIKDKGDEVKEAFVKELSYLSFPDAKLVMAEDGYPEIDIAPLYEIIEEEAEYVHKFYRVTKALIIVVEEYTKKTHSKDFRPYIMIDSIRDIKEDYALDVAPRYSRKLLNEKIAKGVVVTPNEIKRAVYPSYDELQPREEELAFFRDKLTSIRKSYEKK